MLKQWSTGLTLLVLVILLIAACAPKPVLAPSAIPTAVVQSAAKAPAPTVAPTVSSEDAAWAKVAEAAKREGKVNVYSAVWMGDVGSAISRAFKSRYGISVDIVTGKGGEFLERLRVEKRMGKMVGDIVESGSVNIQNMSDLGLMASVGDILPVLREKGVWWVDPTIIDPQRKANLSYRILTYLPYINTRLVKTGEAPNSWKDLLDPKWRGGKMSLQDPKIGQQFYQQAAALLSKKIWDENYVKALFKQELRFVQSSTDDFRKLASGETYLTITGADSPASVFIREGAPIQAVDIREGIPFGVGGVGVVNGGPNPNAALLFLNWLLETEGQTTYAKARGSQMVRNGVSDFFPPGTLVKITNPVFVTMEDINRAAELLNQRWVDKLMGN